VLWPQIANGALLLSQHYDSVQLSLRSFPYQSCIRWSVLSIVFCLLSMSTDHSSRNLLCWRPVSPSACSQCRDDLSSLPSGGNHKIVVLAGTSVDILHMCRYQCSRRSWIMSSSCHCCVHSWPYHWRSCFYKRCVEFFWVICDRIWKSTCKNRIWTIYHVAYDSTSATNNTNGNWKHFCLGLTTNGNWKHFCLGLTTNGNWKRFCLELTTNGNWKHFCLGFAHHDAS